MKLVSLYFLSPSHFTFIIYICIDVARTRYLSKQIGFQDTFDGNSHGDLIKKRYFITFIRERRRKYNLWADLNKKCQLYIHKAYDPINIQIEGPLPKDLRHRVPLNGDSQRMPHLGTYPTLLSRNELIMFMDTKTKCIGAFRVKRYTITHFHYNTVRSERPVVYSSNNEGIHYLGGLSFPIL
jgi:hypothetical protein